MQNVQKHTSPLSLLSEETILNCMHCGLCLPTCPTYDLTNIERYSPRGRIQLARAIFEEKIDDEIEIQGIADSVNSCLGCLACVTACPAGVDYESIFESAKDHVQTLSPNSFTKSILSVVMKYILPFPRRFKILSRLIYLLQRSPLEHNLPDNLRRLYHLAPEFSERFFDETYRSMAKSKLKTVSFLSGCLMNTAFADVHLQSIELLESVDLNVQAPKKQICCGALHAHNGFMSEARIMAEKNIDAFSENEDLIVVNSAGCGAMMKHYPKLFQTTEAVYPKAVAFAKRVRDISELLVLANFTPNKKINSRIAYQDACHLEHGQKIRNEPRNLLRECYEEVVELCSPECCGSAGIYNLLQPEWSEQLLAKKISAIEAAGVDFVVTANPGCLLQIQYGLKNTESKTKAIHLATALQSAL